MRCLNPFCTCCHNAYVEGLRDGYQLGYQRGYNTGYVNGYITAARHLAPPVEHYPEIQLRLNTPPLLPAITPLLPRRKRCTCVGICSCGA